MNYRIENATGFPTINMAETGRRIRECMDRRGLSVRDVKDYLNLASVQGVYHWLEGKTMPSTDNFFALSILFGVTVDDLICSKYKLPMIYYDYESDLLPNECEMKVINS